MGTIAQMRDVLVLQDGAACDAVVAGGSFGDPAFGGSPVPGAVTGNTNVPTCLRLGGGNNAAFIVNQCFDASGNQLPDCGQMIWNGTNLIVFTSNLTAAGDPSDFAYVIDRLRVA
jgi:hypothetical protein